MPWATPIDLRAKHTHLSMGGKICTKTDYKPFSSRAL